MVSTATVNSQTPARKMITAESDALPDTVLLKGEQ
jgi:hypothetical protein